MLQALKASLQRLGGMFGLSTDYEKPPAGLKWRSNKFFICTTIGVGMAVDVFLYTLIVPVIPFILEERLGTSPDQVQSFTSGLLTAYAGASVVFSPVAGYVADSTATRQAPFLLGLLAMLLATVLLYLGRSLPVLVVARVLQGTSGAVVWTVGLALLIDTIGSANLGKAFGTIFSFVSMASLMGPVIGGSLYSRFGYASVFALGAAVLVIDFVMRLLVIERRIAVRYKQYSPVTQDDAAASGGADGNQSTQNGRDASVEEGQTADDDENEQTPLLPGEREKFVISKPDSKILNKLPILLCFRNPSLIIAIILPFVQATLFGFFDSTIPLEASDLYGFDSLKAGLLFLPLGLADLAMGPPSGWAVDKFGTKPVGFLSFLYLGPCLISLRAVGPGGREAVILYCCLLTLNGIGISATAAPAIVEAGDVVEKYHKANPELFGADGPYAQLYGLSSMFFSGGLAFGPVLGGWLRESVGYGNMNLVGGIICILASLACLFLLGGPLRLRRKE